MRPCDCRDLHRRRRIVLTGGPGAGKTAVLELVRQSFCPHVKVLPEAAGILFTGGFPRRDSEPRRAAQRAIFYVQRELELAADAENLAIVLCDRGTVDGSAYWPGPDDFWAALGTTLTEQLRRYDAVIHLRSPALGQGYNHQNPLRLESAAAAAAIDERLATVWTGHPRRFEVASTSDFLDKAGRVLEILSGELPDCCRRHQQADNRPRDWRTAPEGTTASRFPS
ncbi:MAG: ATP-binding protein [Acidobacteriota bacterium]